MKAKREEALDVAEKLTVGRLLKASDGEETSSERLLKQLEVLARVDALRKNTPSDGRL
jgi:hypothetical protein